MLPNLCLEFDNEGERGCGNGAIVDVYNDNGDGFVALFDENGLVDFAQFECKIFDEDFDQLLIPSAAALLESVERFAQTTDVAWVIWISVARRLAHVNSFIVV